VRSRSGRTEDSGDPNSPIPDMSDHYNLLGVSPSASADELRKAFRREAKRCHPDLFADRPVQERESHRLRFIQLAQAYQLLSDPEQRKAYDYRLAAERERQQAGTSRRVAPEFERARTGGAGSKRESPRTANSSGNERSPRSPGSRESGQTAGQKGPRSQTRDPSSELREILKEAEHSLSRFGMDLRQPADVVLEELLDWARALYRDLVGAVRRSRPGGKASGGAATRGGQSSTQRPGPRSSAAGKRTASASSNPDIDSAHLNELDVERELARLKQSAAKGSVRRSFTVDDELEELKRRHRKP